MLDHIKDNSNNDDAPRRNARRAREFHRYLRPSQVHTSDHESHPLSTSGAIPDFSSTFSPHCQLTALRCKARKAMVNLMDRETMYFVSESSLLRNSIDGEDHYQFIEDPILASCTSTGLEGRICELTLRQGSKKNQRPSMFVIPDLAESQFAQLPVVTGPPYYRFYAGTPITTTEGINIGSLAVMDDRPREGLTREQEDFLAITAAQIMSFLETHRQAAEGNRARRMTDGLKAFFAGQFTTHQSTPTSTPPESFSNRSNLAYRLPSPLSDAHENDEDRKRGYFWDHSQHSQSTTSGKNDALDANTALSVPNSRHHILHRAAALIRECLDTANDTTATFFGLGKNPLNTPDQKSSIFPYNHEPREPRAGQRRLRRPARIAARVTHTNSGSQTEAHNHSDSIDEDLLRLLAKQYPEGHLWNLEDDEFSSSDDDPTKSDVQKDPIDQTRMLRRHRRENEVRSVRAAFPSAHQVLFAPLFDADSALTSYCLFVESTNDIHSFNAGTDLPFLLTFCSSITTEISKMEALLINRQKSDFVGTISHEMRSPLHGILGSAEFLAETDLTTFQQSLTKTIEICGKTLLDTIGHVLDYSKINSFEKHSPPSNGSPTANLEQAPIRDITLFDGNSVNRASALSQVATDTDVASMLEEVVDSLVRGWSFAQNIDLNDSTPVTNGQLPDFLNGRHEKEYATTYPEVFIDIEPLNWFFLTQPGGVRRIIMNVVGNALKFTRQGSITISLSSKDTSDDNQFSNMIFTVTDTGSGISSDFLDSKLFLPFAQENPLTPGTGLGLSIVYNIVKMLDGWIDVKSDFGYGTTVQVELPMKRSTLGQTHTHSPVRSLTRPWTVCTTSNDSISTTREEASKFTAAFYPAVEDSTQNKILSAYVTAWCHLEVSGDIKSATVVIVDENDLQQFMRTLAEAHQPKLIVLCGEMTGQSDSRNTDLLRSSSNAFERVAKPCGPRKLARALQAVLEKPTTNGFAHELPQNGLVNERLREPALDLSDPELTNSLTSLRINVSQTSGPPQSIPPAEGLPINSLYQESPITFAPSSDTIHSTSDPSRIHDIAASSSTVDEKNSAPRLVSFRDKPYSPPQSSEQVSQLHQNGAKDTDERLPPSTHRHNTIFDFPSSQELVKTKQQQPRVLLVDDNKVNLRLLETYLRKKRQYTDLTKAEDGQQAVDAFVISSSTSSSPSDSKNRNPFDLIFMDISMPVMDGFAATRAIRQHEAMLVSSPRPKKEVQNAQGQRRRVAFIVAMTGLASAKDQVEGYESGCNVYMTKPVSFKEVSKLLDEWEASRQVSPSSPLTAEYEHEAALVSISVEA